METISSTASLGDAFVDLFNMLLVVPHFLSLGMSFNTNNVMTSQKRLLTILSKTGSWSNWIEMLTTTLRNCADGTFALVDGKISAWSHSHLAHASWIKTVDEYNVKTRSIDRLIKSDVSCVVKYHDEGKKLLEEGSALISRLVVRGAKPNEIGILKGYLAQLIKSVELWAVRRQTSHFRAEPLLVGITGPVATGKSTISSYIHKFKITMHNAMGGDYICPDVPAFFPLQADKYDTAYTEEKYVVCIDDPQTAKPALAADAFFLKLVQLVNFVPMQANMPDIERKGAIFFDPVLVLVTSNDAKFYSKDLFLNQTAVLRRFHAVFRVRLKPEYSNPITKRLDMGGKVALSHGEETFPWIITVIVYVQENPEVLFASEKHVATITEKKDFDIFLRDLIKRQSEDANAIKEVLNKPCDMKLCEKCFLPECDCEVPDVTLLSGVNASWDYVGPHVEKHVHLPACDFSSSLEFSVTMCIYFFLVEVFAYFCATRRRFFREGRERINLFFFYFLFLFRLVYVSQHCDISQHTLNPDSGLEIFFVLYYILLILYVMYLRAYVRYENRTYFEIQATSMVVSSLVSSLYKMQQQPPHATAIASHRVKRTRVHHRMKEKIMIGRLKVRKLLRKVFPRVSNFFSYYIAKLLGASKFALWCEDLTLFEVFTTPFFFRYYAAQVDVDELYTDHDVECCMPTPSWLDYLAAQFTFTLDMWIMTGISRYYNAAEKGPMCLGCDNCKWMVLNYHWADNSLLILFAYANYISFGAIVMLYEGLLVKLLRPLYWAMWDFMYLGSSITEERVFILPEETEGWARHFDPSTLVLLGFVVATIYGRSKGKYPFDIYGHKVEQPQSTPISDTNHRERTIYSKQQKAKMPSNCGSMPPDVLMAKIDRCTARVIVLQNPEDEDQTVAAHALSLGAGVWLTVGHLFSGSNVHAFTLETRQQDGTFYSHPSTVSHVIFSQMFDLAVFFFPTDAPSILPYLAHGLHTLPAEFQTTIRLHYTEENLTEDVVGFSKFMEKVAWTTDSVPTDKTYVGSYNLGLRSDHMGCCGSVMYQHCRTGHVFPLAILHMETKVTGEKIYGCVPIEKGLIVSLKVRFMKYTLDFKPTMRFNTQGLKNAFGVEKNVLELSDRSFLNYVELPENRVRVVGSFGRKDFRTSSKVYRTQVYDKVVQLGLGVEKFGVPTFTTPKLADGSFDNSRSPTKVNFTWLVKPKSNIPRSLLIRAFEDYNLPFPRNGPSLQPCTIFAAINGYGFPNLRSMDMSTSMGFPLKGPKSDHFPTIETDEGLRYEASHEIVTLVENTVSAMEKCNIPMDPFKASFKDEPTKLTKIDAGLIRMFAGAPVVMTIIIRMYFCHALDYFQNPDNMTVTGTALGVDFSRQWTNIVELLSEMGLDHMIAIDYKKFDKLMSSFVIYLAFLSLITNFTKGYTTHQKRVCWCIAWYIAQHHVVINNDLIQLNGSNPSGHGLTTIVNCIVNHFYLRCMWYKTTDKVGEFRSWVVAIVYGDDAVISSLDKTFTLHSIIKQGGHFNIKITPSDKGDPADQPPFVPISHIDFLGRRFVWDPEAQIWRAPLSLLSLGKMVAFAVESSVMEDSRMQMVLLSLEIERVQHLDEDSISVVDKLIAIVNEYFKQVAA